jgi:hypothetical protein
MNVTRSLLTLSVALCAAASLAETAAKPATPPAAKPGTAVVVRRPTTPAMPRVADAAVRSNMFAKTGGILASPVSGPSVLFLNAQTRVPAPLIREPVSQIEKLLRLPCILRSQPSSEPVADAVQALSDTSIAAVIVIGDASSYPSLLLAPESRWALVNVAALGGDGVPADRLADRVQKETMRAFGMLLGAAHSNFESCVLKPVLKPEDLDALKAKNLSVEPLNKILAYAQRLGIHQSRPTTYRKAVEEGWAPAPTNDIQRAIWQELKK